MTRETMNRIVRLIRQAGGQAGHVPGPMDRVILQGTWGMRRADIQPGLVNGWPGCLEVGLLIPEDRLIPVLRAAGLLS